MHTWQRDRIVAFYEKYNPENLKNIPEILRVFSGREEVLCGKLFKKYGCQPDILNQSALDTYEPGYLPHSAQISVGGPLDHRSEEFNASKALEASSLTNDTTKCQPLDNLYKCRMLLPLNDPNCIQLKGIPLEKKVKEPKKMTPVAAKKPPILHAIADNFSTGPLGYLRDCLLAKAKVVVVIRRINSIRGTCTGYLKGFDKHMNLVLLDVVERLVSSEYDGSLCVGIANWRQHPNGTITKYAKQLLIRGDNIVMIYPTRPLPPSEKAIEK